ncbi:MAG: hypothetical protein JKY65_24030 [Planctomycetes bacterium]|nr:hypothetical protein [Planctomycetota bacterium]
MGLLEKHNKPELLISTLENLAGLYRDIGEARAEAECSRRAQEVRLRVGDESD